MRIRTDILTRLTLLTYILKNIGRYLSARKPPAGWENPNLRALREEKKAASAKPIER